MLEICEQASVMNVQRAPSSPALRGLWTLPLQIPAAHPIADIPVDLRVPTFLRRMVA